MINDHLKSPMRKVFIVFIVSMVPVPILLWYVSCNIINLLRSGGYWTAAVIVGFSILVGYSINGLNFWITYKIHPDVRMSGIPIPVVFEEFEDGIWYDYPVFYGLIVGICYFSLISLAMIFLLLKVVSFWKLALITTMLYTCLCKCRS